LGFSLLVRALILRLRSEQGLRGFRCVNLYVGSKQKLALLKSNPPKIGLMNYGFDLGTGVHIAPAHTQSSACLKELSHPPAHVIE
jgi:hypothetical protein